MSGVLVHLLQDMVVHAPRQGVVNVVSIIVVLRVVCRLDVPSRTHYNLDRA